MSVYLCMYIYVCMCMYVCMYVPVQHVCLSAHHPTEKSQVLTVHKLKDPTAEFRPMFCRQSLAAQQ